MADEKPGEQPVEGDDIDLAAVDTMSDEEIGKLKRGEADPPRKKAREGGDDDFDEVDPKSETVPHGKFHRVNERRKQAEQERDAHAKAKADAEARADLAMRRLSELLEASKPAKEPEPEDEPDLGPDPDQDPLGAVKWMREQKAREFAEAKQRREVEQTGSQAQRIVAEQATRFSQVKAQHPVLDEAYKHLLESVAGENALYGLSGIDLTNRVHQWEAQVAQWAHRNNQPIEEVIWNLAQRRGFRPPDPNAGGDDGGQDQGGSDQPRGPNGQFVKAAAEMDRREATKAAAKSLGGGGGPADVGEITPQKILEMSEDEYVAFKKKHGERAMRVAFGSAA